MFSEQNNVIWVINKIVDMIFLSVLWVVCSIPIITIGASSAALYHTVTKAIREDNGYPVQSFFRSFKSNFRPTLVFTVFSELFLAVFGSVIYFCYKNPMGFLTQLYAVFSLICILVTLLVWIHVFSLTGRFTLNGRQLFTLAVRLIGRNIPKNFLLLCLLAFAVEAGIYYPPLLFIVPSGYTFLVSVLEEPVFAKYINVKE